MTAPKTRIPVLRQARWWFIAAALLLVGSLLPLYAGSRRTDQWVRQMEDAHCVAPLPPLPDLVAPGWATVGLIIPGAVFLVAGMTLFVIGSHRRWVKSVVVVAGLIALLVSSLVLLIGYDDATKGVDRYSVSGSDGGPLCPSGW